MDTVTLEVVSELIEEGVKDSRLDNHYARRQSGKNRDAARRELGGRKSNKRNKSGKRNNSYKSR